MSGPRAGEEAVGRWIEEVLDRSRERVQAPRGFTQRVMDAVYRQSLAALPGTPHPSSRAASRLYRRIAVSFMLTAALLSASLFVPRGAYPSLIAPATAGEALGSGPSAAVRDALRGAAAVVQGALGERQIEGGQL